MSMQVLINLLADASVIYTPIMKNQMEKNMENKMETLYRDNGKENGNYYNGLYRGYIGVIII